LPRCETPVQWPPLEPIAPVLGSVPPPPQIHTPAQPPVAPPQSQLHAVPVAVAPLVQPTPPVSTPPAVPEPQPAAVAASPQADLLQAFLRGAGLDQLRIDKDQAEAQMESIGRSYRLMVEGLIDVLRARSSLKGEFRMQQTMIRPVENNPLKFAPNVDEALLLMLRHSKQAFMAPDQAVQDSFDDLRAHQLAVMAGVEAAIKHLLQRFEPTELEARMGKPGGLGNLFSGSRQAQYWQQFTALYSQISREAQDDFQDLFGREFSRAYEEHTSRVRRS
jgi:type VI secretion system protein